VILESVELEIESAVCGGDCIGIVPFEILSNTIPEVNCFEIWIISRVKCPSRGIELVGEL